MKNLKALLLLSASVNVGSAMDLPAADEQNQALAIIPAGGAAAGAQILPAVAPADARRDTIINALGTNLDVLRTMYASLRVLAPTHQALPEGFHPPLLTRRQAANHNLNDIIYKSLRNNIAPHLSSLLASGQQITNGAISKHISQLIMKALLNQAVGAIIPGFGGLNALMGEHGFANVIQRIDLAQMNHGLDACILSFLAGGATDLIDFEIARYAANPAQGNFGRLLQEYIGDIATAMEALNDRHPAFQRRLLELEGQHQRANAEIADARVGLPALEEQLVDAQRRVANAEANVARLLEEYRRGAAEPQLLLADAPAEGALVVRQEVPAPARGVFGGLWAVAGAVAGGARVVVGAATGLARAAHGAVFASPQLTAARAELAAAQAEVARITAEIARKNQLIHNDGPATIARLDEEIGQYGAGNYFQGVQPVYGVLDIANIALPGLTLAQELALPPTIAMRAVPYLSVIPNTVLGTTPQQALATFRDETGVTANALGVAAPGIRDNLLGAARNGAVHVGFDAAAEGIGHLLGYAVGREDAETPQQRAMRVQRSAEERALIILNGTVLQPIQRIVTRNARATTQLVRRVVNTGQASRTVVRGALLGGTAQAALTVATRTAPWAFSRLTITEGLATWLSGVGSIAPTMPSLSVATLGIGGAAGLGAVAGASIGHLYGADEGRSAMLGAGIGAGTAVAGLISIAVPGMTVGLVVSAGVVLATNVEGGRIVFYDVPVALAREFLRVNPQLHAHQD